MYWLNCIQFSVQCLVACGRVTTVATDPKISFFNYWHYPGQLIALHICVDDDRGKCWCGYVCWCGCVVCAGIVSQAIQLYVPELSCLLGVGIVSQAIQNLPYPDSQVTGTSIIRAAK